MFIVATIALQQNNAKSCLHLFHNCLSIMINNVYREAFCISTDTYNQSLTEKHGILEVRTLKSGLTHQKMIIILTSVKQAQMPNILYCVKTCVFLLFQC